MNKEQLIAQRAGLSDTKKEHIEELETVIEEEFAVFQQGEKEVKNCEIMEKLIALDNTLLELDKTIHSANKQRHKKDIDILNETHYIKKSQSKNNVFTYGLVAVVGTVFGMSSEKWLPFAGFLWELFKFTK